MGLLEWFFRAASYWQRALIRTEMHSRQEKSFEDCTFLQRTDLLAVCLGVSVQDLPAIIGISRRLLFQCRSDETAVTNKTWLKLEKAEREAGVGQPLDGPSSAELDFFRRVEASQHRTVVEMAKLFGPPGGDSPLAGTIRLLRLYSTAVRGLIETLAEEKPANMVYDSNLELFHSAICRLQPIFESWVEGMATKKMPGPEDKPPAE